MHSDDLSELADNPNFISGIYNYCDRWCERCAFSSRCLLYASEQADPELDDPEVRDLNNEKFWRKLESIFRDTQELITKWADEAELDLNSIDAKAVNAAYEQETQNAEQHELSVAARNYADMVERWFVDEDNARQKNRGDMNSHSVPTEEDIDADAAFEVIRWYQFFIAAKIFRALLRHEDISDDFDFTDEVDHVIDDAQTDSNGSAKIALISIDRSSSAWSVIRRCRPEREDSILPLQLLLEKLRLGIEQTFPHARDFIRPGFDEVTSAFAS